MGPNKSVAVFAIISVLTGAENAVFAQAVDSSSFPASQSLSSGTIGGRITNQSNGNALPGATLRLQEINRETVSGSNGNFLFTNIPPGSYTLVVSYEGLDAQRVSVTLASGGSIRQDIGLSSQVFQMEEVLVRARVEGYASTINIQRNADSVRTVVSADALGQIREGNIGDALVRLPGLSVETRAGVQRTATIRGLAPQYNTVTVNGLRMTNVDGNRDIALDSFPSNMLSRVEVIKSPTPDISADAIGGTVQLITSSAFDSDERTLKAEVGTTYNDNRGSWNRQIGLTWGDIFGEQNQFGLLGSIVYFNDNRGYDVVDTAYTVSAADSYFINRSMYYDRDEKKDKIGAGLVFDFRPTDETSMQFNALYHYDYRELWRRATDYRPGTATNVTPTSGQSTGGRVDSIAFYREPKNVFQMYSGTADHRAGSWQFDATAAYSKATKTYPETVQILNSFNGVDLNYDRSNPDFPVFTVTNGVDLTNPGLLQFRSFTTSQVPRSEDEWSLDGNTEYEFTGGPYIWSLKAGLRATFKEASQAQPDTIRYSGVGVPAQGLLENYSNSDFMKASDGRAVLVPFFPDWRSYRDLQINNPGIYTQNAAARLFTDETKANADFDISEDILSSYLMTTVDFNGFQVLGGVRVEKTKTESEANEVVVSGGQVTDVRRVSNSGSYTSVLPGLHARYAVMNDRMVLRSSVTKAISRPPPGDLIAARQENAQLNQRIIGNPDLKPAESINVDLTAEYYLPPLGVLSAGYFYKDIDNFVFSSSRIATDGVDERTRVNGDGGEVHGLEFVWLQQLTFLPGFLSGLGVEANYTWMDSKGVYPNRPGEDLPFINSPKYIFNGVLSYTAGPVDMRVSYNRLPERLESVGGRAALDNFNAPASTWDTSFKYKIMDQTTVYLNIKNLTNVPTIQYRGSRGNPITVVEYGRQYNVGLQAEF